MRSLGLDDYATLHAGGLVIEADSHGDKVILLPDGTYLKLFRRKRLLSSALLRPYAARFANNCVRLRNLGIPCPEIINVFRIKSIARDVVHYRPLAGRTIRSLLSEGMSSDDASGMRADLGRFVGMLHSMGVYFRSLHLGNIVLGTDGRFGLIDIADLGIGHRTLSRAKAIRNLRHLLRYQREAAWLVADNSFDSGYRQSARFPVCLNEALRKVR